MDLNWTQNEVFVNFLEFGSLDFLEVAYNDSLQQYLTSCKITTHKKIFFGAQILAKWAKIEPKVSFFWHILKFRSLVFLGIAYSDSLQQCLKSIRGKTLKKNWGPKCWPKSDQKLVFLCHFFKFGIWVSFKKLHRMIVLEQCLDTSRGKIHKKFGEGEGESKFGQNEPIRFFVCILSFKSNSILS